MYDNFRAALDSLWFALCVAIFGGLADMAAQVAIGNKVSLGRLIGNLFVSAFAGVIVHLFLDGVDMIPPGTKAALVGLSGYSGVAIVNALSHLPVAIIKRVTGQRLGDNERDNDV